MQSIANAVPSNGIEATTRFAQLTVQYHAIGDQDNVDRAVQQLLTNGQRETAEQVRHANETLLRIATADPRLAEADLQSLVGGDFKALNDNVRLGAGFIESFENAAPHLASGNFAQTQTAMAHAIDHDTTRQAIDKPTVIRAEEIDFSSGRSMEVIPTAVKFILPVPSFADGGEPLVYPESHAKAGQPVVDYEGKPLGERGIVFANRGESIAAASGDGASVMIINNVTQAQAEKLQAKVAEYAASPEKLTVEQYKAVLTYARDDMGLTDIYNSSRSFVAENMSAVGKNPEDGYGTFKRDSRDIVHAVYIDGNIEFHGTSKSADGVQHMAKGALVIQDSKGEVRAITREKAIDTYMLPDGKPLDRTFDVLEIGAAQARDYDQRGLNPGQVPHRNMAGEMVGVDMPSNLIVADGLSADGKAVQGSGKIVLAKDSGNYSEHSLHIPDGGAIGRHHLHSTRVTDLVSKAATMAIAKAGHASVAHVILKHVVPSEQTPPAHLPPVVPPSEASELIEKAGLLNKALKFAGLAVKYLGPVAAIGAPLIGAEEGGREALEKHEGFAAAAQGTLGGLAHGTANLLGVGDGIRDVIGNGKLTNIDRSLNAAEHVAQAAAGTLALTGFAEMATGVGIVPGAITEAGALGTAIGLAALDVTKGIRKVAGYSGQDQDGGFVYGIITGGAHMVEHLISGGEVVHDSGAPTQTAHNTTHDKTSKGIG